jgi:hypothetical protein
MIPLALLKFRTLEDNQRRVHLRSRSYPGLIPICFAIVIHLYGSYFFDIKGFSLVIDTLLEVFFVLFGMAVMLYRTEIKIDFMQRQFEITQGFLPNPKIIQGSLDKVKDLTLAKKVRTTRIKGRFVQQLSWLVEMNIENHLAPFRLLETKLEKEARDYFVKMAGRLGVRANDTTDDSHFDS